MTEMHAMGPCLIGEVGTWKTKIERQGYEAESKEKYGLH